MMRWIIQTSMRLQYLVIVFAIAFMGFAVTQIQEMPVDVFPEFNPPLVEVQTEALGLSSEEMESLITVPLEADLLNGVAWLDQIYSETVAGMSSILLVFEEGTDPIRARQMVQERLTQTFALPNVSKPPTMLQPLSASNRVMMVGLSTDDMPLIDMSVLAHWVIAPRLLGVNGVANVSIWGQREWQLQVQVDPKHLDETGVTLQQVIETTGEAMWFSPLSYLESSTPGTSGWIDTPNQRLGIQHILPISAADDLRKVPVLNTDGLLLGDVANVVEDHQILIGDALLRDGPGLMLVIEKFPNANTVEVTKGIEEAIEALQPGMTGIDFDTNIFRASNYVETAMDNLSSMAVISVILGVIVLAIFYFGWRSTLISVLTVALSLVTAVYVIYLRGMSFNIMILAGLFMALAIIIHNSIVDVDNLKRRLRQRDHSDSETYSISIITNTLLEMREPLAYALLVILLSVLPIFFIGGITGSFFQPFAVAYILAILSGLAVALIVTPALSFILLNNVTSKTRPAFISQVLDDIYRPVFSNIIQNANLAMIIAIVITLAGVVSFFVSDITLMPPLKQTDLRIQWEGAPSTSREAMLRVTNLASNELEAIPGVRNVGSHVGRAITGDKTVGINAGEIWVNIDPDVDYDETLESVREVIDGYPGLFRSIDIYEPQRLDDVLTQPDYDMVVRVYGHDFDQLNDMAESVSSAIASVDGLQDIQIQRNVEEPQIEIEVDLDAAQKHQIKPGDVRRAATTLLSGLTVGNLYEEQKVFEVVVWGSPELRDSVNDIEQLRIDTPVGQVPLGDLAEVRIAPVPISIRRDAVQRFIDVAANLDGRDHASVAADIEEIVQNMDFPLEYHAEVISEDQIRPIHVNLPLLIIAVIVGIYLVLQAAYQSWHLATVVLLTLPVAIAGGLIAILLSGGEISIGSLFGLLALFGISVRIVTVTTSYLNHSLQASGETISENAIFEAMHDRTTPIVMTLIAIAAALLPFAISGSVAGTEIISPMIIVILGGLISTAILALLVLPALYLRFGWKTVNATIVESNE